MIQRYILSFCIPLGLFFAACAEVQMPTSMVDLQDRIEGQSELNSKQRSTHCWQQALAYWQLAKTQFANKELEQAGRFASLGLYWVRQAELLVTVDKNRRALDLLVDEKKRLKVEFEQLKDAVAVLETATEREKLVKHLRTVVSSIRIKAAFEEELKQKATSTSASKVTQARVQVGWELIAKAKLQLEIVFALSKNNNIPPERIEPIRGAISAAEKAMLPVPDLAQVQEYVEYALKKCQRIWDDFYYFRVDESAYLAKVQQISERLKGAAGTVVKAPFGCIVAFSNKNKGRKKRQISTATEEKFRAVVKSLSAEAVHLLVVVSVGQFTPQLQKNAQSESDDISKDLVQVIADSGFTVGNTRYLGAGLSTPLESLQGTGIRIGLVVMPLVESENK